MGVNSNGEEVEINDTDESNQEIGQINYKQQYIQLKKKLKLLLFVSEITLTVLHGLIAYNLLGERILSRESAPESEAVAEGFKGSKLLA